MEKYDQIGVNYNSTRTADPYLAERMIDLFQPKPGKSYLDIGCGTGNYTRVLAAKGAKFVGVDPSETMLTIAEAAAPNMDWRKGHAEQLPLESNSVVGVLATLTMHHWASLKEGFKELARVCSSGNLLLFTATPEQMEGYWLNHYFPEMMKLSMDKMPELKLITEAMEAAGFQTKKSEAYFVKEDLQDQFLYSGKHRPLLYFDESFRAGISSFSALISDEELASGIIRLKMDIATGAIAEVQERYRNKKGDYLFIVAEK